MSWASLSWGALAEVAVGLVLLAAAVVFYRRRATADGPGGYGSQGAVIVGLIAIIMLIHGLGGLDYHPSQAEIDAFQERAR